MFAVSADLIRQTDAALASQGVVESLTQQMEMLNNSLRVAFSDIRNMHVTLESARRIKQPQELYIAQKDDHLDSRVSEFNNKYKLPISFVRASQGTYMFGSKKVQMELVKDRLRVLHDSQSLPIEEFVQMYGQKEVLDAKDRSKTDEQQEEPKPFEEDRSSRRADPVSSRSYQSNKHEEMSPVRNSDEQKLYKSATVVRDQPSGGPHDGSSYSPDKGSNRKRARKQRRSKENPDLPQEQEGNTGANEEQINV